VIVFIASGNEKVPTGKLTEYQINTQLLADPFDTQLTSLDIMNTIPDHIFYKVHSNIREIFD
jgi:hypothetical protein